MKLIRVFTQKWKQNQSRTFIIIIYLFISVYNEIETQYKEKWVIVEHSNGMQRKSLTLIGIAGTLEPARCGRRIRACHERARLCHTKIASPSNSSHSVRRWNERVRMRRHGGKRRRRSSGKEKPHDEARWTNCSAYFSRSLSILHICVFRVCYLRPFLCLSHFKCRTSAWARNDFFFFCPLCEQFFSFTIIIIIDVCNWSFLQ